MKINCLSCIHYKEKDYRKCRAEDSIVECHDCKCNECSGMFCYTEDHLSTTATRKLYIPIPLQQEKME